MVIDRKCSRTTVGFITVKRESQISACGAPNVRHGGLFSAATSLKFEAALTLFSLVG
jgi:hypothetical protein